MTKTRFEAATSGTLDTGRAPMLLMRFLRNRDGGVAPLLALAAIPIMGSVGAAIDFSRAASVRTSMQAALDATGLMLSKETSTLNSPELNTQATNYFKANFARPEIQNLEVTTATSSSAGSTSVTMSASGSVKTEFMGIMGFSTLKVAVRSSALTHTDEFGCVLSLNPHASGAITGQGSTSIALKGCSLYDNSDSATALTVGGSAGIAALSVGVVGYVSGASNITTTQGIYTKIGPVTDPYASASYPNFFGCDQHNFNAKSTITIDPGVYCGGISANAGANVTLNPGIYYLDGGDLTLNGGATLTGVGVTLVFTKKNENSWATATVNGNATVNLTPPNSGPTAGIVIFGDRAMPVGTSFKFNGGATQYLGGAVYLPAGAVDFSGGSGTSTSCTQIIGDTVVFSGNSTLAINCSSYKTKPFGALFVRLTS